MDIGNHTDTDAYSLIR